MVRAIATGDFKQRLAVALICAFALQSVLRLILLIPIHGSDRESVIVHGWGLISLAILGSAGLVYLANSAWGRIVVAASLAVAGVLGTIYDITAFITGLLLHRALSLAAIGSFYCAEGSLADCAAQYWTLTASLVAWVAAWAAVIAFCAKDLAAVVRRWWSRLDALPWFDPRFGLGLVVVGYALFWAIAPSAAQRYEPIYTFLTKRAFVQGPVELVSLPRPDYRVAPTPGTRPRPLILITVDSLRADSVQLGPGGESLTPFLRELAGTGRLRDFGPASAICGSSYCGIVGLQSSSDWATQQHGPPLTLPDVLAVNGYRSVFLLSGPHRTARNLGTLYGPNVSLLMDDASPDSSGLSDDREQVRRLRTVPIADPARTYLSIHLMSAHVGGRRFGAGGSRLVADYRDVLDYAAYYRRGVRQADGIVRQLFAILEKRGLLDDALVIITADHGERTGPHEPGHLARIDRATTAIPLLIYDARNALWPAQPLASQLDVAPTLLAGAGIATPATWRGQALQTAFLRAAAPVDSSDAAGLVGLVSGRRVLFLCDVRTGATEVRAYGLPDLTSTQREAALAQAAALHKGLARRRDAARCFNPAAAARPR